MTEASEAAIVWAVIFGAIGTGYLIYGRKQRRPMAFVSGLALIGVPYFVDSAVAIVVVCIAFMALPFFIEL